MSAPYLLEYDVRGASIRKTGTSVELRCREGVIRTADVYAVLESGMGAGSPGEEDQSAKARLLALYSIIFYNSELHGWENLARDAELPISVLKPANGVTGKRSSDTIAGLPRLHVMLEDPSQLPQSSASVATPSSTRSFGIGIYQGKTAYNLITLQRAASQLGARFVFSIEEQFRDRKPLSQSVAGEMCPLSHYPSLISFSKDLKRGVCASKKVDNVDSVDGDGCWEWVGIEMGGVPLEQFVHPERAVYILGSENNGLSSMLRGACKHVIELPSVRTASFNVAVAGSLVMYDRVRKERPRAAETVAPRTKKRRRSEETD
eukprot:g201.t1